MKAKHFFYCCLLICISGSAFGQDLPPSDQPPLEQPQGPRENFWDKIYIGGNIGLQFGSVTYVNLSPQIGYRVTKRFIPGIGITYIYYSYKIPGYAREETNIYGGSIFGKYFFTDNLFGHVEYEELNIEGYDEFIPPHFKRSWVPAFLVGGGYSQPIGEHGFVQLMVLFEVLQDRNSLYYGQNPIVRIGFGF